MKRVGQKLYNSVAWRKLRLAYMASKNWICERCGAVATICHHRRHLTATNADNATIALNFDNLEALCQTCHNLEHAARGQAIFNSRGDVVAVKNDRDFAQDRQAILELFKTPQAPPPVGDANSGEVGRYEDPSMRKKTKKIIQRRL